MNIRQRYKCSSCHSDELANYPLNSKAPECCGKNMKPCEVVFPRADPVVGALHMVKLLEDPEVEWNLPTKPLEVFEIWQLRPGGRVNGEKIGVLGVRQTTVEWVTPNGVAIRGGFSMTIEEAVGSMLEALQGGVHAASHIKAELV